MTASSALAAPSPLRRSAPASRDAAEPGARLGADRALTAIDDAVDALFSKVRARRVPDTVAAVVSNLSDYGLVWVALAAVKSRRRGRSRRRALAALALCGVTSYGVNKAVKQAVQRARPEPEARTRPAGPLPVRTPTSSSFPSGHTLAAFCTALALPESGAGAGAGAMFAAAVAASRIQLRAHHGSDVLAGAAIGTILGLGVRRAADAAAGRPRARRH